MKKIWIGILSAVILAIPVILVFAGSLPHVEWIAKYHDLPGVSSEFAYDMAIDSAGNVYVTGVSGTRGTGNDFATVKYDPNGKEVWVRRYHNYYEIGYQVALDSWGNVYVSGTTLDPGSVEWDIVTIKYDSEGNEKWKIRYGLPDGSDNVYDMAVDAAGNVFLTGCGKTSYQIQDYLTIKYDTYGKELWVRNLSDHPYRGIWANSIAVDDVGNAYVTGFTDQGCVTIKYDPNGNELWAKSYSRDRQSAEGKSITVDPYGNVYVAGYSFGRYTNGDYLAIKYDAEGNEQWANIYNGPGSVNDNARSIAVDTVGDVYITGFSHAGNTSDTCDYATIKYAANGQEMWLKRYNGPGNGRDVAEKLVIDADRNVYVTGNSVGGDSFGDYATVKYDTNGNEIWVERYDGDANREDWPRDIAVDGAGNVYVTGHSYIIENYDPHAVYATIKYSEDSPPVAEAAGPYLASEGALVALNGAGSTDLEGDIASYAWDLDGDGVYDDAFGPSPMVSWPDNLALTVGLEVTDSSGQTDIDTADVTVNNLAPAIVTITTPIDPIPVNTPINAGATFTDAGVLDTHTAVWSWDDGTTSAGVMSEANGSGSVAGTHSYSVPGVYTVTLTITDDDGGTVQATSTFLAIYNAEGGFVTGAGLIESPPGAYSGDPSLTGNAHFAFVSRYQKGATAPTGQTQFRFQVADLNFNSNAYEWLVVAGARAQFKGTGTIDNVGGVFKFMIVAIDGQIPGGGGVDKFRIKIWDQATEAVIYDNELGSPESGDPSTAIKGGNIVIHKE